MRGLLFVATFGLGLGIGAADGWAQAPDPDINNDGVVNILDVSLVSSCQGMDPANEFRCQTADTDDDGDIDRDDLDFVTAGFGQDGFAPCGDDNVDPGEECDDGNTEDDDCCSALCQVEPRDTVCRPSAGSCDLPELCNGEDGMCPTDAFEPATTLCRPAAGICDVAESCTGAGPACPTDGFQAAGTLCRAAAGPCDAPEVCTGAAPLCPPDGFQPAGVVCRPSAGSCDPAEACTGAAVACPGDVVAPNGTLCRPALGACDVQELCFNGACPPDVRTPGALCRPAVGDCDLDEFCGADPTCPADLFKPTGADCGDQGIDCLNDDRCDGAGTCVDNGLEPAGTACGDQSNTECSRADSCDGAGTCDANHEPPGTDCGDQGVDCRKDDACDGAGACVDNGFEPPDTDCGDPSDTECTDRDTCDAAGVCQSNDAEIGAPCGDQGVDCRNDDACDGLGSCFDNGLAGPGTFCGDGTDDECTSQDTCDAEGVCQPNHAPQGTACGDQGVECQVDDTCDGAGVCQDNGPLPDGTTCTEVPIECTGPGLCKTGMCEPQAAPNCDMNDVQDPTCGEECDGLDDLACPGLCQPDCTCGMPPEPCTDACEPNTDPQTFGPECDDKVDEVISLLPFCQFRWDQSCVLQADLASAACPAGKVLCDGRTGDLAALLVPQGFDSLTFRFDGDPSLKLSGTCIDGTRFGGAANQDVTITLPGVATDAVQCWSKVRADDALCSTTSPLPYTIERVSPTDFPFLPVFNDGSCLHCDWIFDLDVCTAAGCSTLSDVQLESHFSAQSVVFPGGDSFLEIVDRLPPEPATVDLGNGITLQVDGRGQGCGPAGPMPSASGSFGCGMFGSNPTLVKTFGTSAVGTCFDDSMCQPQCSSYCSSFPNFPFTQSARCVDNLCECSCLELGFTGPAPAGTGFWEVPVSVTVFENGTQTDQREGCRRLTTQQTAAEVFSGTTSVFGASETGAPADSGICTAQGTALDTALRTATVGATNLLLNLDLGTQGKQDVVLSYTASPSCFPAPLE